MRGTLAGVSLYTTDNSNLGKAPRGVTNLCKRVQSGRGKTCSPLQGLPSRREQLQKRSSCGGLGDSGRAGTLWYHKFPNAACGKTLGAGVRAWNLGSHC